MTLLLLHGLGATGAVWSGWAPLLDGPWSAPDLPGHGTAAPLAEYTFDALAEALVPLVDPDGGTVVVGHSLGGVVALALAARVPVARVVGLGIKVAWSAEDLDRAQALAARPVTWFATREEAVARHLRVAGLTGLVDPKDKTALAGVLQAGHQWRQALDPAAFGVGAPAMASLLAAARAPVVLARGELDPMSTDEQLAALGAPTVTLAGLGHNAHVESPERCLQLLTDS